MRGVHHASRTNPIAAIATTIPPATGCAHGQRNELSTASSTARAVCTRHNITTPEKSSPAWVPRAAAYESRPPLAAIIGMAQTRAPMTAAPNAATRSFRRNPSLGITSASPSRGAVRRSVCERTPTANPATNAPRINVREAPRRAIAETTSACAATAAARPVMSLSGRSAVNQKSGAHAVTTVAHRARHSPASSSLTEAAVAAAGRPTSRPRLTPVASSSLAEAAGEGRLPSARKNAKRNTMSAAAREHAPDREPARLREPHARRPKHGGRRLSEGDEDGISGRMGLVLRDVEVGDAEGEIDRVDVFERRRQEPEVRRDEQERERRQGRAHGRDWNHTSRRRSASFRLPRRYPRRSIVTWA